MILQSLCHYYDCLVSQGKLEAPGWQSLNASYRLEIDEEGRLITVGPLFQEKILKNKSILVPQLITALPSHSSRTCGIKPFFLCDNSTYILGFDEKDQENHERARECFEASAKYHEDLLGNAKGMVARAILSFFKKWNPADFMSDARLDNAREGLLKGANIVFGVNGIKAEEDQEIKAIWQEHYDRENENGERMRSLVSGEEDYVALLHPPIKGVQGAQSTGAYLISYNKTSFTSYGLEQGRNSPVSQHDAFAYGEALNYLLRDRDHRQQLGDATIVAWAETAEVVYQDAFSSITSSKTNEQDIMALIRHLADGKKFMWDEKDVDPGMNFFILALSPNASRLSVRFFLKNTIGGFAKNIARHYERLEIIRPSFENNPVLYPWRLVNETVNQNSRDKTPSPQLTGNLLQAILTDTPYPATLYNGLELRIKADHDINWRRAAIIKAYLIKNVMNETIKEALTVTLNEDCNYVPYVLGRLFSVLENIQDSANPGLNATIKDKYFNSACSTPSVVFPVLIKLSQSHLRKIGGGLEVALNKKLGNLLNRLTEGYPNHLSLYDQGIMQLGYYHETQKRFEKKKEEK